MNPTPFQQHIRYLLHPERNLISRLVRQHVPELHEKDLAYSRAYLIRNRERVNSQKREISRRWKKIVFEHYSNGEPQCACCGEKCLGFLTIDHIKGGGNKHLRELRKDGIGFGASGFYQWLVKNNFPEGFQVLCYNCNMAKGRSLRNICPHQQEKVARLQQAQKPFQGNPIPRRG